MFDALTAIGALLLGGVIAARIAERVRLPRLTGHLVWGMAFGALCVPLLGSEARAVLLDVERATACVIAYSVGSLLGMRDLRASARTVGWLVVCSVIAVVACSAVVLPLLLPRAVNQGLFVVVVSLTLAAVSPTVVAVVSGELGARGPLTHTLLSGVVVADVLLMGALIVLSTVVSLSGSGGGAFEPLAVLGAALVAGTLLGSVMARLLRGVPIAYVLGVALLGAHLIGQLLGPSPVAPLAASVAAGIAGGTSVRDEAARRAIVTVALPLAAALLFGLEGLLFDASVFAKLLVPACALVAVRSLGVWFGARVGSGAARADPSVRRWAFAGFLPQAGFALAIASLLPDLFPRLGEAPRALAVGVIAINELVMPAVLRHALTRAGEAHGSLAPLAPVAD